MNITKSQLFHLLVAFLMVAGVLIVHGEDKTTAPVIRVELSAKFWQAYAQQSAANAAMEAIKAELTKACGANHFWNVADAAKPSCDPKPKNDTPTP